MKSCAAFARLEQFIMLYVWSKVTQVGNELRERRRTNSLLFPLVWFCTLLKKQKKNSVSIL